MPKKQKDDIGYRVRGFKNLGNTCFLNAVLQNLAVTGLLREHFDAPAPGDEGPTTRAMRKFLGSLHSGSGSVSPSELLKAVSQRDRRFRGRAQQDSQEVLRQLLEAVRAEEVARLKPPEPPSPKDTPQKEKRRATGGSRLFGGSRRFGRVVEEVEEPTGSGGAQPGAQGGEGGRNPSPEMRVVDLDSDCSDGGGGSPDASPTGTAASHRIAAQRSASQRSATHRIA